jgi:FMN phosphatase YigB (HAD superfamily)
MDAAKTAATAFVRRQSLRPAELLRRLRDPAPPVAGLLIDLCGVLYDDSTWPRWLFKLVQRLGLHTTYTPFFRVWRREYLDRVKRQELEYWQALRLFLRSAGLTNGQIDEVEAASHARLREFESELLPLPGVVNVLTRLNELEIPLTLVSSACLNTAGVCQRLDVLGLESYFESVVSLPDLWCKYPDRPAFQVAAEITELAAHRLGFVGRDAAVLAQAGEQGIRRIAVNYDEDAAADVFIRSFDRLLHAVPWDIEQAAIS